MTRAAAESDAATHQTAAPSNLWLIVSWGFAIAALTLFAIAALTLFAINAVRYSHDTETQLRRIPYLEYSQRVDYGYFYAGAEMAWHGDAADLYPEPGELTFYPGEPIFLVTDDSYARARLIGRGNYYNPPLMAFLQAPLTTIPFRESFWLFSLGSVALLGGYVALAWFSARGIVELPLLILGAVSFKPVHEVIIMGHWSLLFVFAMTAGLLAMKAQRPVLTGACFSLFALKPQWAILPGLFLVVRGQWRALAVMAAGSTAVFFSGFVFSGWHSFENYVAFIRHQSKLDLIDAPHMFSWNGFLFKLKGSAGDPTLIYSLIGVTAVILAVVWWSRDLFLGCAATIVAMLLVSTHSVWYDWSLLIVAALFIILRPERSRGYRIESWIVLLALYVAASQSMHELLYPSRYDIGPERWYRHAFFSLTPVSFAALLWMASVAARDGLLHLNPFRPETTTRAMN